jgi:hypothetical protein
MWSGPVAPLLFVLLTSGLPATAPEYEHLHWWDFILGVGILLCLIWWSFSMLVGLLYIAWQKTRSLGLAAVFANAAAMSLTFIEDFVKWYKG